MIRERMDMEQHREMKQFADAILQSEHMRMERELPHHNTNAYEHSVGVAYLSFRIVRTLHLRVDAASLLRGALLHDFYLYNCHEREKYPMHLTEHPEIAYRKASEEYQLNGLEADIILHHMFPITPVPPKTKEGILVCIADKLCAGYEVLRGMPVQTRYRARLAAAA